MSAIRPVALALLAAVVCGGVVWAQLDPPPGPVTPTMKPLDEVEPRRPISAIPFQINESGSYYLTQSLTMADGDTHGIIVNASSVTIDLDGFELRGAGAGSGNGRAVSNAASLSSITVGNGIIRDWGGGGVVLGNSSLVVCEDLRVLNNGGFGISVGNNSTVRNCVVQSNVFGLDGGFVCRVENVLAASNSSTGITVNSRSQVLNCTAVGNGSTGIRFDAPSTAQGNLCVLNSGAGIQQNTGSGGLISGNTCNENQHGISSGQSVVTGNSCSDNTQNGIEVRSTGNLVEHNYVSGNAVGINLAVQGAGGFFGSNRATGNTVNYNLGGNPVGSGDTANITF